MARRVLGVLLLAMAAGQASDPGGFVDVLSTYDLAGVPSGLLAVGLIVGELAAGVGVLRGTPLTRVRAAQLAMVVTAAWSVLGLQAFARGLALDNCGCFGVHLGQPLRWWVLAEDVEFMALAWWSLRSASRSLDAVERWARPTPRVSVTR